MYYKIIRGYSAEDYIEIDSSELEKAYYCFLEKKDGVYSGGAVKGSEILAIQPDYHRIMGWNRGHKLDSYDYAELAEKGIDRKTRTALITTQDKVKYLIQTKQTHLIGQNVELPDANIKALPKDIQEGFAGLVNKLKPDQGK
jgi:hypothetical protein